jgi:predicted ATP-grasp superfamily ATP-dependent carboligase
LIPVRLGACFDIIQSTSELTVAATGLNVLVLDAQQRSALAATRSLSNFGLKVATADMSLQTLAGSSKCSSRAFRYPNPSTQPEEFVSFLSELTHKEGFDVVVPMTDLTTMLLTNNRELFEPAQLTCASARSYEALTVKSDLVDLAISMGIPTPRTLKVSSIGELRQIGADHPLPFVLKPSRSRYLARGVVHSTSVSIIRTRAELERTCAQAHWLEDISGLVQEFIPGSGAGVFALGDGQNVVAWFAHRRVREKPPTGGVSVLSESAAANPDLKTCAERLLKSVDWFGPAMIEYRISPEGIPYLMEVNGRFWGSLQLAIDSGVDFPALAVGLLSGTAAANHSYTVGKRLRWLLGDLDNLLIQLKQGPVAGSRLKVIADFLATFFDSRTKQEIFRWDDPTPSWFELRTWLRSAL